MDNLNRLVDVIGRTRFVLERQDDGTWSFGAPSMLSYSPRPGDMVTGATPLEAIAALFDANTPDAEPAP